MSRIDVLGVGFDDLTRENAIDLCKRLIDEHRSAYMVTPNPEIVMAAWENAELHDAICNADLVIPDGIGVVKAARIIGTPLKERLPGIEIGEAILEYAAQTGKSVFLLGAKPGVADAAKEKMQETYPGLNVCGTNDGYFKDDDPVIEKINAAQPDFLMVCLGAPKQELWMAQNAERLYWTAEEVDAKMHQIMTNIYNASVEAAERYGLGYDLVAGANIAGFQKVADAMMCQGIF